MIRRIVTMYSVYELDEDDRLVRRLYGKRRGTMRQGEDGVWQSYSWIEVTPAGLVIAWGTNEDGSTRLTVTSAILNEEVVRP